MEGLRACDGGNISALLLFRLMTLSFHLDDNHCREAKARVRDNAILAARRRRRLCGDTAID